MRLPAPGVCASTVPAGFFETTPVSWTRKPSDRSSLTAEAARRPTTFGTAFVCTAETVRVTTECLTRSAPGPGSCATTVPGACALGRVTVRAIRPFRFSRTTASCCLRRTTFGTFTVDAPLSPLSRVSSQAATSPPITSASRSSSHGQISGRGGGPGGGGGPTSSSTTAPGGRGSSTTVGSSGGVRRILTAPVYPFAQNPEPAPEEIFAIHPKTPNPGVVEWGQAGSL